MVGGSVSKWSVVGGRLVGGSVVGGFNKTHQLEANRMYSLFTSGNSLRQVYLLKDSRVNVFVKRAACTA